MPRPPPKSSCSSGTPSATSSRPSPAAAAAALTSGSSVVIWEPMCTCTSDRRQPRPLRHVEDEGAGQRDGHAELVVAQAGRDVRMALRIDVRIDAQRDPGLHAAGRGEAVEAVQLAWRLHVDGVEIEPHRALEFAGRLAHAREHDVARGEAAAQRHVHLAHRVGIGVAAKRAQQAHDGQRGVGLQARSGCGASGRRRPRGAGRRRRGSRRHCRHTRACPRPGPRRRRAPPRSSTPAWGAGKSRLSRRKWSMIP